MTSERLFTRAPANPLLVPDQWPYLINAVLNPAATEVDGETILLCRVEDRRGLSHLSVARSADGVSDWSIDEEPLLAPDPDRREELWGLEDPRITRVDELDAWVIAYTSFGPGGPGVSLAQTKDFRNVERLGMVMSPEDKNGVLLPRRVGGEWILFHRPRSSLGGPSGIWLSRSSDLRSWAAPEEVMPAREGAWWDSARIGMGPPPIETDEGWLVVYHGVREAVSGGLYRVGLALLDLEQPARVLRRVPEWVLGPQAPYELTGDAPGVVFPGGLVHERDTGRLRLYYGAADTVIALATAQLDEVLAYVLQCPAP